MTNHMNLVRYLASCVLLEICRNCKEPVSDISCAASLCQNCWALVSGRAAQLEWCLPPSLAAAALALDELHGSEISLNDHSTGAAISQQEIVSLRASASQENSISHTLSTASRRSAISRALAGLLLAPSGIASSCVEAPNTVRWLLGDFILGHSLKNKVIEFWKRAFVQSRPLAPGRRDPSGIPGENHFLHVPLPVTSATVYEGIVRSLIHTMKYRNDPLIAADLAALLPSALYLLEPHVDLNNAVLVPIPLSRLRFISRGFNQAEILAAELGKLTGIPVRSSMLARKHTTPQHNLVRDQRFANLRGTFRLTPGARLAPTVILVDDIYTSGATILEAACVLRRAGVNQVAAVTVARAVLNKDATIR